MKTNKLFAVILIPCLLLGTLSGCRPIVKGSGKLATERRKAIDFKRITIKGAFYVRLTQDSSLSISITADDNLLKYISTDVDSGKLVIGLRKSVITENNMVLHIGVRHLNEIRASGAMMVSSTGKLNTGELKIILAGDSKFNLDLYVNNLVIENKGRGELNLNGQAVSALMQLNGVTKINAFKLHADNYTINTAGDVIGQV